MSRSICDDVRQSTELIVAKPSRRVWINTEKLEQEVKDHPELYSTKILPPNWAQSYHFSDGTDLTAQYCLVLDSINFCFWPLPGYEYLDLASGLKRALEADRTAFDAERLEVLTAEQLTNWLQPAEDSPFWNLSSRSGVDRQVVPIPLVHQRVRCIREVGHVLRTKFGGSAANMIRSAEGDAVRLVEIVTQNFRCFQDHAAFRLEQSMSEAGNALALENMDAIAQVHFYKRAQIFVGDVFGAYNGQGLGKFDKLDHLTCFADYRLPQLLFALGILCYDEDLTQRVLNKAPLPAGGADEVLIRACTVQCVELMCAQFSKVNPQETLRPFQLDWILWERGESLLSTLPPHHRCLTMFY